MIYESNTALHAAKELEILCKTTPDAIIKEFIPEVLALVEKFGQSGQSGASAPFVARIISSVVEKLCLQETISPLTGEKDEWACNQFQDDTCQNLRQSAIFKHADKPAYYLDAIIWQDENGHTWSGSALKADGTRVRSRQYIKSFPFTPRTFYIKVRSVETAKDDWTNYIINEDDLNEVFEYYDEFKD